MCFVPEVPVLILTGVTAAERRAVWRLKDTSEKSCSTRGFTSHRAAALGYVSAPDGPCCYEGAEDEDVWFRIETHHKVKAVTQTIKLLQLPCNDASPLVYYSVYGGMWAAGTQNDQLCQNQLFHKAFVYMKVKKVSMENKKTNLRSGHISTLWLYLCSYFLSCLVLSFYEWTELWGH